MSLSKPRAILFDWDNTLVDSWTVIRDCFNPTLEHFGQEAWTLEQIKARVARSLRDTFPEMFGDRWEEAKDFYYETFRAIHIERLSPLEGSADTVKALHEQGIYLGIVSNKTGAYLRQEVEHLGWDAYFGNVVGAADAPRDKPASDPVHMALAGSGIEASCDVWFVGDAKIDMECAHNAGCTAILVGDEPSGLGDFQAFPPHHRIKHCPALPKLAKTL